MIFGQLFKCFVIIQHVNFNGRFVIAFLIFLGLSGAGVSQIRNLRFDHLGTGDGLSHSNTICIFQDSRGFMWFGTRDGLNKYDGYTFTVYKNENDDKHTLVNNYVTGILEDPDGGLWIGTWGGLSYFDRNNEQFTSYKHNEKNPNSLSSDIIHSILLDSEGHLWIGTDKGLDVYDRHNNTFRHYAHEKDNAQSLSHNVVNALAEDTEHGIWVGTDDGLNRFDLRTKSFTSFRINVAGGNSELSNIIEVLYTDEDQNVWIGTSGDGLYQYSSAAGDIRRIKNDQASEYSFAQNFILSINEDTEGNIWIGTENGGLNILNKRIGLYQNFLKDDIDQGSLSSNSVWSIYKDSGGDMWLGTFSGDINFRKREGNRFAHYRHGSFKNTLSHDKVLTFYEDSKNNLWIGTDGGGVNLFNRETGQFNHFRHKPGNTNSISSDYVLSILEDSKGNLWFGTWAGGITVFNPETNSYKHYKKDIKNPRSISSNNVWTLFEDKNKTIWIGTYDGGLNRFNAREDSFTSYRYNAFDSLSISGNNINSIFEDLQGQLWIGTESNGLNVFDSKTGTFKCYRHSEYINSISSNSVNEIRSDSIGNLWIGTMSGLNYFDRQSGKFTAYRMADGLPNDAIFGIQMDHHGNLWLGTNKGISKFNVFTRKFENYGIADGLQSDEFKQKASLLCRSGAMYFGGNNGFNEFFPDSIHHAKFQPPLVITKFELFNSLVPIADSLNIESPLKKQITEMKEMTLSYKHSVISFEFASLIYTNAESKKYSYMLEGFDKDWSKLETRRLATYTNLDPGKYILKVRGVQANGEWATETLRLTLIITPPYWKTWWFLTIITFAVLGSIISFVLVRVNMIRNLKIILEEKIRQSTAEVTGQKEALEAQAEDMRTMNDQLKAQTDFLQQINDELEQQREEAEKAKGEAEKANKAKSIFLATMSHEIRTPMNGVLGMASLLSETTLTTEQKEYTDTIRGSGEALLTVINDILDFSKIESGNLELDNHAFDLRQCIEDVMDMFATKSAQKGLDLVYQIDNQIPAQIVSDSHRLRQILLNLMGNAMKFTHQGEIFVKIDLLKIEKDQMELAFQVRDTGIGIPQDKLSRLFKAFSQVDSSTTRKYGGTGLGLVISQRLVELMGGSIGVESQPGVGTSFGFTVKGQVGQESIRQYVNASLAGNEGKKVLVVDDNATNLTILKNQLEQWKLEPTLASSGSEALQFLSGKEKFDLVITDMQMPDMDGVQLTKLIKAHHVSLPVILLSSIGDESKKKHPGLFAAVLNKPVKQQQFSRVLHSVLRPEGEVTLTEDQKPKQLLSEDFAKQYPLRILIAEDNPVNQKLTLRVLNKLGYQQIEIAHNGLEAVEKFDEQFYDVILMDVQMPEMDGLEATRMIRLKQYHQPVIISMTANAMQGDREECMKAGMDDYISKPVKLEVLVSVLEKWALQLKDRAVQKSVIGQS